MPLPPLAILHGDDEFAIAGRLAELKAEMGEPSLAALNITELDGKTVALADLRGACDTMPFLTPHRLIIVRGLLARLAGKTEADETESATPGPAAASAQSFIDGLVEYLPQLMPTTSLIFAESRPVNERSRIVKAAAKAPGAEIKKFEVPQGAELGRWIMRRAKASGGEFTAAGAEALALAAGEGGPRLLANEIEKLLAYVNWARPVERADVEQLTPAAGEAQIWDLVDALGARNAQLALNKFHTLLNMPSQDQFAIFGMIVRQFRLLLQVREILDGGGGQAQVMQMLGQKPYPAEKLTRQARNFALPQLEAIYRRLLDLDLALKSGAAENTTAIDTFIAALTM
jgi:DNA polymerase-3 subunit delta